MKPHSFALRLTFLTAPPLPKRPSIRIPSTSVPRATLHAPVLLTAATSVGVLSTRFQFIPPSLRGAPVSFISGALLQAPSDCVLTHAPAAVALLLLTSGNSNDTGRPSRSLTAAFALGSIGTLGGAVLGALLFPSYAPLAAAFAATYIGGSLNFVAVVAAVGVSGAYVAAAITADIALMALYFAALFAIASRVRRRHTRLSSTHAMTVTSLKSDRRTLITSISTTILAALIHLLTCSFSTIHGLDIVLTTLTSLLLRRFIGARKLAYGAPAANIAVMLFFAALGGCVSFTELATVGSWPIFILCLITLLAHSIAMIFGRLLFRLPTPELLVASNANVGGPTTAASFAGAVGWTDLVGPAAYIGAVGYAIATPIALFLLDLIRTVS